MPVDVHAVLQTPGAPRVSDTAQRQHPFRLLHARHHGGRRSALQERSRGRRHSRSGLDLGGTFIGLGPGPNRGRGLRDLGQHRGDLQLLGVLPVADLVVEQGHEHGHPDAQEERDAEPHDVAGAACPHPGGLRRQVGRVDDHDLRGLAARQRAERHRRQELPAVELLEPLAGLGDVAIQARPLGLQRHHPLGGRRAVRRAHGAWSLGLRARVGGDVLLHLDQLRSSGSRCRGDRAIGRWTSSTARL